MKQTNHNKPPEPLKSFQKKHQPRNTFLAQLQLPKTADTKLITSCGTTADDEPDPPRCALGISWTHGCNLKPVDDLKKMFQHGEPAGSIQHNPIHQLSPWPWEIRRGVRPQSWTTPKPGTERMATAGFDDFCSPIFTWGAQTLATKPTQRWRIMTYSRMT